MPPTTVYTVSQVSAHIKALFANDEDLADIWLSGEVSNFKQATSGHCYFTLKDAAASIRAVMWRTQALAIRLPREGDAVLAHGYVSVYEPRGDYQFYVDTLEPGGVGWLWQEFQRLKERLAAEGLFADERKRPLVERPCRLGVATSASGAALRDILRTLSTRFPLVEVVFAATPVQGDEAPAGIVAALALLNRWSAERGRLDAIILARGGGAIEELWSFNHEGVARAIAASAVPVITGIGHETDFTIADFVADYRAPTPTGAAAAAVPDGRELAGEVTALGERAYAEAARRLAAGRADLDAAQARLARLSPQALVAQDRQRLDELGRRGQLAIAHRLAALHSRLEGQQLFLAAVDPTAVLARGYAIVSTPTGLIITTPAQVAAGDPLQVRVAGGSFDVEATARKNA